MGQNLRFETTATPAAKPYAEILQSMYGMELCLNEGSKGALLHISRIIEAGENGINFAVRVEKPEATSKPGVLAKIAKATCIDRLWNSTINFIGGGFDPVAFEELKIVLGKNFKEYGIMETPPHIRQVVPEAMFLVSVKKQELNNSDAASRMRNAERSFQNLIGLSYNGSTRNYPEFLQRF